MAGRLAPFIELGVGFNQELTRARKRRPQRRDDGPDAEGDARPPRLGDRVRRTRGVRRPEAEELLLGDAGAARLLGDARGRRRRAADRRGAGGRRRRLPAEVRRRLPRDESGGQDDRPRHPRDGDGRGVLPPGDADQRRRDPAHRRPGRGRPPLPAAELRTRQPRGPAPHVDDQPRRRGASCSTPGSRTRAASGVANVEHGETIRIRAELEALQPTSPALDVGFIVANADGLGGLRVRRRRSTARTASAPIEAGRADDGRARRRQPARRRAATSSTAASTALDGGVALYVHNARRLRRLRRRRGARHRRACHTRSSTERRAEGAAMR